LAAIGGIMIPKFVMPAAMQAVANWSAHVVGIGRFPRRAITQRSLRDIAPKLRV